MSETQAVATVKIDNAQVRVTEWRFAPGAHTGHHRHEYAYVVVPLVTGALAATAPPGRPPTRFASASPTIATRGSSTTCATRTPSNSRSSRSS